MVPREKTEQPRSSVFTGVNAFARGPKLGDVFIGSLPLGILEDAEGGAPAWSVRSRGSSASDLKLVPLEWKLTVG